MLGGMAVALPLSPPLVVTMPPRTFTCSFMPFPSPAGCLLPGGPSTLAANLAHMGTPITHVGLEASQSPYHTVSIRHRVNLITVMGFLWANAPLVCTSLCIAPSAILTDEAVKHLGFHPQVALPPQIYEKPLG